MTLCDVCSAEGYPYNEATCKDCEYNPNREEKIRVTDLISKKQMVEKINDLFLDKYETKANSDLTEFYKEVLKILINEKGQSNWTSVKDRLPEKSVPVLICATGHRVTAYYDKIKEVFRLTEDDDLYYLTKCVTHWTYLPDVPESEDDEK